MSGLLGDTAARDYSRKLRLFNAFAEAELRLAIASLDPQPGARVLDAGCGTGEALRWFADAVGPAGTVVGIDLAAAHATAARACAPAQALVLQADLLHAPLCAGSFDRVWCMNTVNHLRDPLAGAERLAALLRPAGRIALCQSSLLPDMYFAWDARLERLVNEAVRQYYRDRYGVSERELAAVRALVGVLRRAPLRKVRAQTFVIERVSPLGAADEAYLAEAIFRDSWGTRLQPYLSSADYDELARLCDPQHPQFALRRTDFHFLQTFTVVSGEL
ncbi:MULTISPECIES: class I SAM-dependent methyltransferase [Rhodanobacter]|uniref:class I SAM-dependent methyltransferase n=1 Tax=Rhodanobacter TaxID=75309 RepID=UPI0003F96E79|nr:MULTISPECIES: methyltransferase domain-containing protein [Rhodanobacter]TAN17607.1 MAG: methyltransferase domain-containing protein [Rhodanobacter sp.]UJJ53988.1 methyltransferase domain-containing protein [Rhodanobacter thiooxydans]